MHWFFRIIINLELPIEDAHEEYNNRQSKSIKDIILIVILLNKTFDDEN